MSRAFGRQAVHRRAVDGDAAGALGLEPGDDAQQGGFPAARGAQDGDELARRDVEVDAIEHGRLAELLAEPGNAHGAPHGTRSGRIGLHDEHSGLSLPPCFARMLTAGPHIEKPSYPAVS